MRETYLYHFPRPEDAAALRHVLALLLELNLENPRLLEPADAPASATPTRLELAAVTRDLRYCQGFLQQVARESELSSLSPVDAALTGARLSGNPRRPRVGARGRLPCPRRRPELSRNPVDL